MRTTIDLDSTILAAAKEVAAQTGESLGQIISHWSMKGLQVSRKSSRRKDNLFPTFDIPPDAPPITSQIIRKLISDEGLPPRH